MSKKSNIYICYWDCNGFESITDCTAWERSCLLNVIAGKTLSDSPVNLSMLLLRARMNAQRYPEIWQFNTDPCVSESDLWLIAEEQPQELVNMIRKVGTRLAGEEATFNNAIV